MGFHGVCNLLIGVCLGEEGWAMLSLPGFAGWDLLGWLVRLGLLDSVCMLGFVVKGLLGQVY